MEQLFLLTIDNKHGDTNELYTTEEAAKGSAYDYVVQSWIEAEKGPMPTDIDEALDAYFADNPEEDYRIEPLTVQGPTDLPAIVYADEAVASWQAHLNAITGWNVQVTLADGSKHDGVIRGAGFDDAASGLGGAVWVAWWADGKEPDENTEAETVPVEKIARIRVY